MCEEQQYFGNDWGLFVDIEKGDSYSNQFIWIDGNKICINNVIKKSIKKDILNINHKNKSKLLIYAFSIFSIGIILYST